MKILILFFILCSAYLHASVLTLHAVEHCPYTCSDKAENKGFLVDIITQVYKKEGYTVVYTSSTDYEKSLNALENGKYDLMTEVAPTNNTKLIYMKKPLGYGHNVIAMVSASKWKYNSNKDLEKLKLAVIKELKYTKEVTEHINKFKTDPSKIQILSGHLARKHNLRKLRFYKVNAIIDDRISLRYFYYKKKKPFKFKIVHTSKSFPIHIAFSPKGYRAKKYSKLLYKGLKKFRGSQKMKDIMKKYGLSEAYIRYTPSN